MPGWLLAASLAGCTRAASDASGNGGAAGSTAAAPAALGAAPSPLQLASETAFDLTVSERGALLGWADASAAGVLHVLRFAASGARAAPAPTPAALPPASGAADLTLVDAGSGVALIWRTPGQAAMARGLWLDGKGTWQSLELGATWPAPGAGRGNLALAARGEGALALVRGPRETCRETAVPSAAAGAAAGGASGGEGEPCFGFRFYQLSAAGSQAVGLGLHVPVPCDARAALLLSPAAGAEQRYHYAVCTHVDGETVLTAFSIEPARSYAAAQQVLPGCQPLGAGLFAGQPTFVAECGASRRLARFVDADAPFALQSADVRGLVCSRAAGGPLARVRLGESWLDLAGPQAQLELLLDAELAPHGSRAVWTGEVLLVARAAGGQLALDRFSCEDKELVRSSIALE